MAVREMVPLSIAKIVPRVAARSATLMVPFRIVVEPEAFANYLTVLKKREKPEIVVAFMFSALEVYSASRGRPEIQSNFILGHMPKILRENPNLSRKAIDYAYAMLDPKNKRMDKLDRWAAMVGLVMVPTDVISAYKNKRILFERILTILKYEINYHLAEAAVWAARMLKDAIDSDLRSQFLVVARQRRQIFEHIQESGHGDSQLAEILKGLDLLVADFYPS